MKILYCAGCNCKVAKIEKGSTKKGAVMICGRCETKRKALEIRYNSKSNGPMDIFNNIFNTR